MNPRFTCAMRPDTSLNLMRYGSHRLAASSASGIMPSAVRLDRTLCLMKTVLIIFFLSVQSSYSDSMEISATEDVFDTVQFYSANGRNWRIKTCAINEDVHIWSLGADIPDIIGLARANTEKNYGDVLSEGCIIETEEGIEGIRAELAERGLSTHLEFPGTGAVFWSPEGAHYRSKSVPT